MAHHPLLTVMCSAICSRRKGQGRWMPKGVHLASDHARKRSEHRRHDRWTYEQSLNSGGCLRNPISAKRCAGPTPDAARTDQSAAAGCRRQRSMCRPAGGGGELLRMTSWRRRISPNATHQSVCKPLSVSLPPGGKEAELQSSPQERQSGCWLGRTTGRAAGRRWRS